MAKINTDSLAADITQRIASLNSGSSGEEYLYTAVAARSLDRSNTVATVNDLPDLLVGPMPDGIIVFVESLGVLVISANTQWVGLDGGLVRNDLTSRAVWSWGSNGSGQLGDGTVTFRSSPVSVIGGFTDWSQISTFGSTSGQFSLALRANGTAWSWGLNSEGRLGDGTTVNRSSPVSVIGGFTDWCAIAAGQYHSLAIRTNGTLWSWGRNSSGQLGDDTTVSRSSPVSVVGGFTDWCGISARGSHNLALRSNGTVWSWGANIWGRLGDGTQTGRSSPVSVIGGFTDWCAVAAGGGHSLALRANGTAWAWGRGICGQLGNNLYGDTSSPVSVIGGFTDWSAISAGNFHSLGLRSNGTLWSWGSNSVGRLGDGTTVNRSSPVSVIGGFADWTRISAGLESGLATRSNGTLWSWGRNDDGQLGDGTVICRSSPVSVIGGITDWSQISAGFVHSLAIRTTA